MARTIVYGHGMWNKVISSVSVDFANNSHCGIDTAPIIPEPGDVVVIGNSSSDWRENLPAGVVPGNPKEHYSGNNYWGLIAG